MTDYEIYKAWKFRSVCITNLYGMYGMRRLLQRQKKKGIRIAFSFPSEIRIHHAKNGGGQMLICVGGRGYYQEWGKEAVEMIPGTVINIPAEVKHWHGAAPVSGRMKRGAGSLWRTA